MAFATFCDKIPSLMMADSRAPDDEKIKKIPYIPTNSSEEIPSFHFFQHTDT